MSNDIYPLQKLTAYSAVHFLNKARGRLPNSANYTQAWSFCGVNGGLIPTEVFITALLDKALAYEIAAQRYRTAAKAVEIWRQEPIGANTMEGVAIAWQMAEVTE